MSIENGRVGDSKDAPQTSVTIHKERIIGTGGEKGKEHSHEDITNHSSSEKDDRTARKTNRQEEVTRTDNGHHEAHEKKRKLVGFGVDEGDDKLTRRGSCTHKMHGQAGDRNRRKIRNPPTKETVDRKRRRDSATAGRVGDTKVLESTGRNTSWRTEARKAWKAP